MNRILIISLLFLAQSFSTSYAQIILNEGYDLALSKGIHAINEERYDEARDSFKEALQAKPQDVDASYYLGVLHRLSGRNQQARTIFEAILKRDASFEPLHFDLGLVYFQLKQYENALKSLLKAEAVKAQSKAVQITIHHYLGLSLMELKQFDKAALRFHRVMEIDSKQAARANYFVGIAYHRQGRFDEAKKAFRALVADAPGSHLAVSSQKFLENIDPGDPNDVKDKQWMLTASIGFHYDDNVILLSDGSTLPEGVSNQADTRWVGQFQSAFAFFQNPSSTGILRYGFYQSKNETLRSFDAQNHRLSLILNHTLPTRPYRFDFLYRFSTLSVDDESYLKINTLSTAVDLLNHSDTTTRISYRFQDKNFLEQSSFPGNEDRTGTNNAVTILQEWVRPNNTAFYGSYRYEQEETHSADWDYDGQTLKFGLSLPSSMAKDWFQPTIAAEWAILSYKNTNTLTTETPTEKREDQLQVFTLLLSKDFSTTLSGQLQYLYNKNKSNIDAFQYDRQIVTVTMSVMY